MRLLFTTAPLSGHLFPMVPLAWAARAAGHEVLLATTENFVTTVLSTGLPAVSWGPATDFVDMVADEPPVCADNLARRRHAHGRAFGRIARRCLPGAAKIMRAWQPDLVVCERAEFAGPIAAAKHDVPYVAFHWGVPELEEYRTAATGELANIPGFGALPTPVETLNPWPPGMRLPHAAAHHGMRAVAYNGTAWLPEWLLRPARRPRVCVTFGTLLPRVAALGLRGAVAPMLARLAGLGVELCLAVDDDVLAQWPELAEPATVAGRMPLGQVLPTCDVIVNHGGQGTILTALATGCPQLVLPHMDDQFDNAEAVVKAGAGMSLSFDEFTPALVTERCETLLGESGFGRVAAGVAMEIAAQPSPVETVDLLVRLAA
ncbi:MAG TPA: nucleotide disphospho-sugar-binding domain-containing protein [Pseudonocardiaceae bacterium]